jgi:renal tumor antigen
VNSLREIQAIKRLSPHPNIITLDEVLFDPPSGRLALVFELLEGNLYELMKGKLSPSLILMVIIVYLRRLIHV